MRRKEKTATKSRGRPRTGKKKKQFEVEKIVGHCTDNNGLLWFNIKWKGFNNSHNEWIPENEMDCDHLVDQYMYEEDIEISNRKRTHSSDGSDSDEPVKKKRSKKMPKSVKRHHSNDDSSENQENFSDDEDTKDSWDLGDFKLDQEASAAAKQETMRESIEQGNHPAPSSTESESNSPFQADDLESNGDGHSNLAMPRSKTGSVSPDSSQQTELIKRMVEFEIPIETEPDKTQDESFDGHFQNSTSTSQITGSGTPLYESADELDSIEIDLVEKREEPCEPIINQQKIEDSMQCSFPMLYQKPKVEQASVSVQTDPEPHEETHLDFTTATSLLNQKFEEKLKVELPTDPIEVDNVSPEFIKEVTTYLEKLLTRIHPEERELERLIEIGDLLERQSTKKKLEAVEMLRLMPFLESVPSIQALRVGLY